MGAGRSGRRDDGQQGAAEANPPARVAEIRASAENRLPRGVRSTAAGPLTSLRKSEGALDDADCSVRTAGSLPRRRRFIYLHTPPGLRLEVDEWRADSDLPHDRAVLAEQRAAQTASWRRLREFGDRKWALFTELDRRYTEILGDASPATVFAALLRSSQAAQDVALQLSRVDAHPHGYEDSFCHEDGLPTDLRQAAWKRLELCVTLAVETGHVDAWAARCQRLFEFVDPTYTASELPPFARTEPRAFAVQLADP